MAKQLGFGSQLIRVLLFSGFLLSLAAVFLPDINAVSRQVMAVINALLFLAVLLIFVARKLTVRVKHLAKVMDSAAEGDLTVRGKDLAADEVGMLNHNFNWMLERLAGMVSSIHTALDELRSIGANVKNVATNGVAIAERQTISAAATMESALEIRRTIEEVSASVDGLAGAADVNAGSIKKMMASIGEINNLMESLAKAVDVVTDSIARMASIQRQVNASVNSLLDNSSRTANVVADMDRSVRQIEYNARSTAKISGDVLIDAEKGRESVESTIQGIQQIRDASHTAQDAIESLSNRAESIGKILQVIDEVTDQTKLLALNASIIAAQAGEHGKGFGVVAHEIKELARRTAKSTREIAGIVNGVTEETGKAVVAIRFAEQKVEEGTLLSRRSGEALDKILAGVRNAASQVNEIASSTIEHAQQSERVRSEMDAVATMVEQIVRASEEQTRDGEVISQAAENMRQLAGRVHTYSRSHNAAGMAVSDSGETMVKMIAGIKEAFEVQGENSESIVKIAQEMEITSSGNLGTTKVMEEAVNNLFRQIKNLEQELKGFKTQEE